MCLSASASLPSSRLLFFSSSLSTFPGSCSCTPCRFLPPPLSLLHGAPDAPIQGRPTPGCSSPGVLLPRFFSSWFHVLGRFSFFSFTSRFGSLVLRVLPHLFLALVHVLLSVSLRRPLLLLLLPRTFQSRAASSPDVPVQGLLPPDVPVRVRCSPGCSSPGSICLCPLVAFPRMFQCWGSRCLRCSSPWHWVNPWTIQSRG